MFDEEVGKYKKRSTAKGQPRSKHKHEYETVLLITEHQFTEIKTGQPYTSESKRPTKVCSICGRVDYLDNDDKWYTTERIHLPFVMDQRILSIDALKLPKYKRKFLDKFATRVEEDVHD